MDERVYYANQQKKKTYCDIIEDLPINLFKVRMIIM